jgi:hypothetical protein
MRRRRGGGGGGARRRRRVEARAGRGSRRARRLRRGSARGVRAARGRRAPLDRRVRGEEGGGRDGGGGGGGAAPGAAGGARRGGGGCVAARGVRGSGAVASSASVATKTPRSASGRWRRSWSGWGSRNARCCSRPAAARRRCAGWNGPSPTSRGAFASGDAPNRKRGPKSATGLLASGESRRAATRTRDRLPSCDGASDDGSLGPLAAGESEARAVVPGGERLRERATASRRETAAAADPPRRSRRRFPNRRRAPNRPRLGRRSILADAALEADAAAAAARSVRESRASEKAVSGKSEAAARRGDARDGGGGESDRSFDDAADFSNSAASAFALAELDASARAVKRASRGDQGGAGARASLEKLRLSQRQQSGDRPDWEVSAGADRGGERAHAPASRARATGPRRGRSRRARGTETARRVAAATVAMIEKVSDVDTVASYVTTKR